MIPTFSRAGRNPSNCTIADDPHKSFLVRSSPAKQVPDGPHDSTAAGNRSAVVFASVFAPPAAPALGRGALQPSQQLGHRLSAGLRLLGLSKHIGAAMTGG